MKDIRILFIGLFTLTCLIGKSQFIETLPSNVVDSINVKSAFSFLDVSYINSGYLYDKAKHQSKILLYDGTTNNICKDDRWIQMYSELLNMSLANHNFSWGDVDKFLKSKKMTHNGILLPLGIIDFEYDKIVDDAYTDGLISYSNGKFVENTTSKNDLYEQKKLIAASLLEPNFDYIEVNFVLYDEMYVTNRTDLDYIEIDFDDGIGFRTVNFDEIISVNYSDVTQKNIEIILHYTDGLSSILHTKSSEEYSCIPSVIPDDPPWNVPNSTYKWRISASKGFVHNSSGGYFTDDTWVTETIIVFPGIPVDISISTKAFGNAYFVYANPDKILRKPIILVEGIDFHLTHDLGVYRNGDLGYCGLIEGSNPAYGFAQRYPALISELKEYGYDFIMLDFADGAGYIQKNSMLLVELINKIQQYKVGDEPIIVAGASMGGQIGKFALRYMELNGMNHCARLYVSIDSPHQGANIPPSLQHLFKYLAYDSGNSDAETQINKTLKRPASMQLSYYQIVPNGFSGYRTPYVNTTLQMGYPTTCRKVGIANGSCNSTGISDLSPGCSLFDYHDCQWLFWCVDFSCIALPGINYFGDANFIFSGDMPYTPYSQKDLYTVWPRYDDCPGGYRNTMEQLAPTLSQSLVDTGFAAIQDSEYKKNHCFIPTVSALDIKTDEILGNAPDCNLTDNELFLDLSNYIFPTCKDACNVSPFNILYGPLGTNEQHSEATPGNIVFILKEVLAGDSKADITSFNYLPDILNTTYNYGDKRNFLLRDVTVVNGGELCINANRPINYNYYDENAVDIFPDYGSPFSVKTCECANIEIVIEDGGNFILGDNSINTLSYVKIKKGSYIRIKNGGSLIMNNGSRLYIENGGNIIVESGGNVIINDNSMLRVCPLGYFCFDAGSNISLNNSNSVLELMYDCIHGLSPLISVSNPPLCEMPDQITTSGPGMFLYNCMPHQTFTSNELINSALASDVNYWTDKTYRFMGGFTIDNNVELSITNSVINVSQINIRSGGKLILENTQLGESCNQPFNGIIFIESGGELILKENSDIHLATNSSIYDEGKIIYDGSRVFLNTPTSKIYLEGIIEIADNHDDFVLIGPSEQGFIQADNNPIITGNNKNVSIIGSGEDDIKIYVTSLSNLSYTSINQLKIVGCEISFNNGKITSNAKSNFFRSVDFRASVSSEIILNNNSEILLSEFNNVMLEANLYGLVSCEAELSNKLKSFDIINTSNYPPKKLKLSNCQINNHLDGILTNGGKVELISTDFNSNTGIGWHAIHPQLSCEVNNCTFIGGYINSSGYGIFIESNSSGSDILINKSDFANHYQGIHHTGKGVLSLSCCNISNHSKGGIYIEDGGILDLSTEHRGGYNKIIDNGSSNYGNIHLDNAENIFLNEGFNVFSKFQYPACKIIKGTLNNCNISNPIQASNNNWSSYNPNTDNYLKSYCSGGYLNYSFSGTVISYIPDCPVDPIIVLQNHLKLGDVDNSTKIVSIATNEGVLTLTYGEAVVYAIKRMTSEDMYGNDIEAVDILHQLLIIEKDELNASEQRLMEFAFIKMNKAFYDAYYNKQIFNDDIDAGNTDIVMEEIIEIYDLQTDTEIDEYNYLNIFNKLINKAQLYSIVGMYEEAKIVLESIDICYLDDKNLAIIEELTSYISAVEKTIQFEEPVEAFNILYKKPEELIFKPTVIEETANISGSSTIGDEVTIGSNTNIGENVIISDEASIGSNVTIGENVFIGEEVVIEDNTDISKNTTIGEGTVVMSGVAVAKDCEIGKYVWISSGVSIDKEVKLGDYVEVAENAVLKKNIEISDGAYIGKNVVADKDIKIGSNSIIQENCSLDKTIEIGDNNRVEKDVKIKQETVTGTNVVIEEGINIGKNVIITDYQVVENNIGNNSQIGTNPVTPPAEPFTVEHNCVFAINNSKIEDKFLNGFTVESDLDNPEEIYHGKNTIFAPEELSIFYIWDFGDCLVSTDATPVHIFEKPGTYVVNLLSNNKCDTISKTGAVTVFPNPETDYAITYQGSCGNNNTVLFGVKPDYSEILNTPCMSDSITCISFASVDTSLYKVKYIWDFGDMTTTLEQIYSLSDLINENITSISHTYGENGEYNVNLTASLIKKDLKTKQWEEMDYSVTTTKKTYISFILADFEISDPGCLNDTIHFTSTSQGIEPFAFTWDFGNGEISNDRNPFSVFSSIEEFAIRLIVIDSIGCSDTLVKYLRINEPALALFDCDSVACLNNVFQISNLTQEYGGETYLWDFGDGYTTGEMEPSHIFTDIGDFIIHLTVRSYEGCESEYFKEISVIDCPTIKGILYESDLCGGNPFINDTLAIIDENYDIVSSVDFAITDYNGEFKFNGFQLNNLSPVELYSITTISGYGLKDVPFMTLEDWNTSYPVSLHLVVNNMEWDVTYSGADSIHNVGAKIDLFDNIIVAGISDNNTTGYDIVILKYDPLGNEIWSTIYDNSYHINDEVIDFTIDDQGNIFVTGVSYNYNNSDLLTLKFDNDGNLIWNNLYEDTPSSYDEPISIDVDASGNIYVVGNTSGNGDYDQIVFKYNNNGNLIWKKRYDYNNFNNFSIEACLDNSNNLVVVGNCNNNITVLKYNTYGMLLWDKIISYNTINNAVSVKTDDKNNIIVVGETSSSQGMYVYDYLTVKLDSNNNDIWAKIYSPQPGSNDYPTSVCIDSTNNIIVSGMSDDFLTVFKYNTNGILEWTNQSLIGLPNTIKLDDNQDIYVTGHVKDPGYTKNSKLLTAKYSKTGELQWLEEYRKVEGAISVNRGKDIIISTNNNVYVTGMVYNGNNFDIATIKYSQCPFAGNLKLTQTNQQYDYLDEDQINPVNSLISDNILIYPNPAQNSIIVEGEGILSIELMDITGKKVKEQTGINNRNKIDVSDILPGLYLVRVLTEFGLHSEKIVINRK